MYTTVNCNVNHQNGHNYFQFIPIFSGFMIPLSTQVLFLVMNADIVSKIQCTFNKECPSSNT